MFSSDSPAKIEFQRVFYKQLFYDLFNDMNNNILEQRFYHFQINLFREYSEFLNKSGYKKVLTFSMFENNEKSQILENVFYYLVKTLRTFSMDLLGEEIDLMKKIKTDEFILVQNSLMGAMPKAVDNFSIDFLEKQHKFFCEQSYFNFLISLIKKDLPRIKLEFHNDILFKSLKAQLQRLDYAFILPKTETLLSAIDLNLIENYQDFKLLSMNFLKEINPQAYVENKEILESWGLELGILQVYLEIKEIIKEPTSINIAQEWEVFKQTTLLSACLKNFSECLIEDQQNFHVFIPTNVANGEDWITDDDFNFKFINIKNLNLYISDVPDRIQNELEETKLKFDYFIYSNITHSNKDITLVYERMAEKWDLFLDLVNLHEDLPCAFKISFHKSFACSHALSHKENKTWYRSGISSSYNIPLDKESYNKKLAFFQKNILPLNQLNSDLSKRLISSFRHYRDSLEFQKDNPAFAFGSLWLCMEVLSRDFNAAKVAKKLCFAPAILTDEFYTKKSIQNLSNKEIIDIYIERKKTYETIIEALGELRNTLIFHKKEVIVYQKERLTKHINLLRRIVIRTQQVVLNELLKDNSIIKIEEVNKRMENRIYEGK